MKVINIAGMLNNLKEDTKQNWLVLVVLMMKIKDFVLRLVISSDLNRRTHMKGVEIKIYFWKIKVKYTDIVCRMDLY